MTVALKFLVLAFLVSLGGCSSDLEGYRTYYPFYRDTDWQKYRASSDITLHIKVIPNRAAVHIIWEGFGHEKYMEWRLWKHEPMQRSIMEDPWTCSIVDEHNFECSELVLAKNYHFSMVNDKIIQSRMITREGTEYTFSDNYLKYFLSKYAHLRFSDVD